MDMKAKSAQLWDALRKSETTGAFTIFPNATGEIEQALTEAHDAGLAEEQAWGKNYRDNIVRLERERSALTAELAAAQEELESIQPDTDEHRTIADSIAGHRKWASATEKCERMCLEKAEKAEAEVIRQRGVNAALVIEKQKREAAEKERDRFQNQLGEKFPTSFGKLDWACGHTGPAACLQCFEGKCASADTLARELAAKNERLEYLEGQDRSLLEQHQASMITLGDSDLLAVSGRLLDRAEKAEAERDALKAAVKVKDEALQDAMGVLDELPDHWTVENLERVYDVCKRALSPESEKPAPSSPDRCACGGIILADTEDWEHPLCDACYVKAGEPKKDPAEKPAPVVPSMVFHKPGCLHSDGYCDCYVIDKPAPSNVHTARMGHCQSCGCMTKTVAGKCGKCGAEKPAPDGEGRKMP
jgi:hypothetical protein